MGELKKNLVYSLNIDEVHNHHLPYVHKFFVIFLTCLQDGTQKLVFAESYCQINSQQLTNSESMATALGRVLRAVTLDTRSNLVAIVSDRARLNLKSLDDLSYTLNFPMPPVVFDPTHLIGSFSQQLDMFCCESVTQLMTTNFMKETFSEQVSMIIGQCHSKDIENLCIFWELCDAVQSVLKMVMRHQEQCILMNLKNDNLEIYCKAAMKQMPILDGPTDQ
ncbi:uncharacterized protein LOC124460431 [Drosophila willistoni]|uniref:uncharacterized protein LOC124460431 n=1 Tax=Drosophila willistoni TaxID=7260 RepID=UPI00017D8DAF|nr:uncharacterized protein LOC124460431 [Drosophila willistoni]